MMGFLKSSFILLFFLPIFVYSQQYKIQPLPIALTFVSGVAKGYSDVINYRYEEFKIIHPNANDQYWNPDISWTNKWKVGSTTEERFWGSSRWFVPLTDANHMFPTVSKYSAIGAIVIKIGDKQKFIYYVYDFIIYTLSYSLFHNSLVALKLGINPLLSKLP